MAPSDSRSVNRYGHGHLVCKFPINVTVPYFMMGDNRDNSTDSRVLSQVGYVPFENLIGRAGTHPVAPLLAPISSTTEYRAQDDWS